MYWVKYPDIRKAFELTHKLRLIYIKTKDKGVALTKIALWYKEFTVNPVFPSGISHVSVSIPSPYGTIHNNREMKNDVFLMNLEIPFNTTARILVNKKELKTLKINRKPWADYAKLNDIDGNTTSVLLGSGVYNIEYSK